MTPKKIVRTNEPTPESTTAAPMPDNGVSRTEDELTANLAAMDDDVYQKFMGVVGVFERQEGRARRIEKARELRAQESLDVVERVSLHVVSKLALSGVLTRSQVHEDGGAGLYWLFRDIDSAIREALPSVDTTEVAIIAEGEAAKQGAPPKQWRRSTRRSSPPTSSTGVSKPRGG